MNTMLEQTDHTEWVGKKSSSTRGCRKSGYQPDEEDKEAWILELDVLLLADRCNVEEQGSLRNAEVQFRERPQALVG